MAMRKSGPGDAIAKNVAVKIMRYVVKKSMVYMDLYKTNLQ
jgi:hypothetical protein